MGLDVRGTTLRMGLDVRGTTLRMGLDIRGTRLGILDVGIGRQRH